jgi:hypothetical protein
VCYIPSQAHPPWFDYRNSIYINFICYVWLEPPYRPTINVTHQYSRNSLLNTFMLWVSHIAICDFNYPSILFALCGPYVLTYNTPPISVYFIQREPDFPNVELRPTGDSFRGQTPSKICIFAGPGSDFHEYRIGRPAEGLKRLNIKIISILCDLATARSKETIHLTSNC